MTTIGRSAGVCALLWLFAGCESGEEIAALEAHQARLERLVAERQAIAENLNEYRREMERLQERVALTAAEHEPNADRLGLHLERAAPGMLKDVRVTDGVAVAVVEGKGGARTVARLSEDLRGAASRSLLRSVAFDAESFRIELAEEPLRAQPVVSEAAPRDSAVAPLPESSWRSGRRSAELRARIALLESQHAMLGKVVGEVVQLRQRREALDAQLAEVLRPDRTFTALPFVTRLIEAGLNDATLTFERSHVLVTSRSAEISAERLSDLLSAEGTVKGIHAGPPLRMEVELRHEPEQ